MKKLLACLLILCLVSAIICACGKKDNADANPTDAPSSDVPSSDDGSNSDSIDGSDDSSDLGGDDSSSLDDPTDTSDWPVSPNPDEDGKVSKYY